VAPVLLRTSVNDFTEEPVSDEVVDGLLRAAMSGPTTGDQRPWHFVVIRDQAVRNKVPEIHRFAHLVPRAPVALLVCGDETLQRDRGFWVQDCAAATENILLEAERRGLGAIWLGIYPIEGLVQAFRRLINVPQHAVPFSLVALGYPVERGRTVSQYDGSRVHIDIWRDKGASTCQE
jgi:nitroreductase